MPQQGTAHTGSGSRRLALSMALAAATALFWLLAVAGPAGAVAAGPSIQGPNPPYDGDTLEGTDGSYQGNGLPGETITVSRQWRRCNSQGDACEDISGATEARYTVTKADIGSTIRLRNTVACVPLQCDTIEDSAPTGVVRAAPDITALSIARSGRRLTANPAGTGHPPLTVSYRWRRCTGARPSDCADIPGATGRTFTLTTADVRKRLRVVVTASNARGPVSRQSDAVGPIAAAPPVSTSPPRISGSALAGSLLSSTLGGWRGEGPIRYSRYWLRCPGAGLSGCTPIPGATGATYRLTADDVGRRLRLFVVADGLGTSSSISAPTATVWFSLGDPPPPPTSLPLLSPFPRVAIAGRAMRSFTAVSRLAVRAPRGSRVTIRCRGRGCPYRRASTRGRGRELRFRRLQRRLRTGSVLQVFVSHPELIGKYTRFRFRARRRPARLDRCLRPGSAKPVRCPRR